MNLSEQLAHELVDHGIDILRLAASQARKIAKILAELERQMVSSVGAMTDYQRWRVDHLIAEIKIATASTYARIRDFSDAAMREWAVAEMGIVTGIVNKAIGAPVMVLSPPIVLELLATDVLIQGSPATEWWAQQAGSTQARFAREVRMGVAANETTQTIVRRVRDGMVIGRRDAESLVLTSTAAVSNAARMATYERNSDVIKGVQSLAVLDLRTTIVCLNYDKQCWDLDGKPIRGTTLPYKPVPRHFRCRSTMIPITASWKELGLPFEKPTGTRASMDGQVSGEITGPQWFTSRTVAQQNEKLGVRRATLFREGKITFREMLDQRGRPLTVAEILVKHGL